MARMVKDIRTGISLRCLSSWAEELELLHLLLYSKILQTRQEMAPKLGAKRYVMFNTESWLSNGSVVRKLHALEKSEFAQRHLLS